MSSVSDRAGASSANLAVPGSDIMYQLPQNHISHIHSIQYFHFEERVIFITAFFSGVDVPQVRNSFFKEKIHQIFKSLDARLICFMVVDAATIQQIVQKMENQKVLPSKIAQVILEDIFDSIK